MDPEIENIIKEQMKKLPAEIRALFTDPGLNDKIINIGKKEGLGQGQLGTLQIETNLVMLGLVHPDEYQNELKNRIKISDEKMNNIVNAVKEQILNKIQEKLKRICEQTDTTEELNPITEELDKRFEKLPEGIKKIIIETNYHATLFDVAQNNQLDVRQMNTLEETTTGVITGSIHPEEFEKTLRRKLDLPEGIVIKVANEVNEKILRRIREKMEQTFTEPKNAYEIRPVRNVVDLTKVDKPKEKNSAPIPVKPMTKIIRPTINMMELGSGEKKEIGGSILSQKLSSSVQSTTVKTDHSMNNISKSENTSKKVDPYREIPE